MRRLVSAFRADDVRSEREAVEAVARAPSSFVAFDLARASLVRPPLLRHVMRLDDAYLRGVLRGVRASRGAGKRIGAEWRPRGANAIEPQAGDDVWVSREELRPLDDVCTRFVTAKYFPDAFARCNAVLNVVRLYDRLAELSEGGGRGGAFRILFKGGVQIRLVLLEFVFTLPVAARRAALAYLAEHRALSVSDFDFEIVPRDGSAEAIHRTQLACYLALLWYQDQLAREIEGKAPPRLLDLSWDRGEAGREELRALLQAEVDSLPDGHAMQGARVDAVFLSARVDRPPRGYRTKAGKPAPPPRRNLVIYRCDDPHTTCVTPAKTVLAQYGIEAGVPTRAGDHLYANLNWYIGEGEERKRPQQLLSVFHLARIKHAFTVYYRTRSGDRRCDRLAGEMVDLSCGHAPADEAHAHLERLAQGSPLHRYYPVLSVDPDLVQLRSYTLAGFLHDHSTMLHNRDVPPWQVAKRQKRMLRYVSFLVAHVLCDASLSRPRARRALLSLAEHLTLPRLLAGPLRTGVRAVDHFFALERASLRGEEEKGRGSKRSREAYVRELAAHARAMVGFAVGGEGEEEEATLHGVHLEHADEHVFGVE